MMTDDVLTPADEDERDKQVLAAAGALDVPEIREIPYAAELSRKALHLASLVVPYFMWVLGKEALWWLAPLAVFAVLCDVLRAKSEPFASGVNRVFGFMMRKEEVPPVGGPVVLNGATWVLVTATLLGALFPMSIAVPAFVTFMICDAMAALIGRRFGRHRWPGTSRTVEGSAAFVVSGLLIMAVMPGVPFWVGAVAVLFGAATEAAPQPLNDNVAVPFVTAAVMFVLERFVLGMAVGLF